MRRGFTLLEVMISLAILAVGLVALSNLNGGAVQMHAYSRRATEATLLLRGKMLDLEEELHKTGFSDFDDEKHGTFDAEGAEGFAWSAEILKPDVRLDPSQLLSLLGGATGSSSSSQQGGGLSTAASGLAAALSGGGKAPGGAGGNPMLAGPMGGMLSGQATMFIETLKKSVREVRLTVSWQDGRSRRMVDASQMIVILPENVGKQPAPAGMTTSDAFEMQKYQQTGQPTAPRLRGPRPATSDPDSAR